MNTDYQPNPNNTLYNTIFSKYAKGEMNLNLDDCLPAIQRIEKMSKEDYLENFKDFLDEKCGDDAQERKRYEDAILARKEGLREEYRTFFNGLIWGRIVSTKGDKEAYPLDEYNRFIFKDEDRSKVKNVDRASDKQNKFREDAPKRMPIKVNDLLPQEKFAPVSQSAKGKPPVPKGQQGAVLRSKSKAAPFLWKIYLRCG
jgi:hypothetical protein